MINHQIENISLQVAMTKYNLKIVPSGVGPPPPTPATPTPKMRER